MHVPFDESNPSNDDKVICDDDDIIELPIEYNVKDDHVKNLEHKDEMIK